MTRRWSDFTFAIGCLAVAIVGVVFIAWRF
jgi:hypothetical protein